MDTNRALVGERAEGGHAEKLAAQILPRLELGPRGPGEIGLMEAGVECDDFLAGFDEINDAVERLAAHVDRAARERLRPGDEVMVASFGQKGMINRLDLPRGQAMVHVGLGDWSLPLSDLYPTGFSPEA